MYNGYQQPDETVSVIDIREGDIMKAKPKYFEPRPASAGNVGQHPVIILTSPDAYGRVQIATMSHSHPHNPPTRPASRFGLPIDPIKGESTVSVGTPYIIHVNFLRPMVPPVRMTPSLFGELKNEIWRNGS